MGADQTVEVRTMSSGSGRPPVALPREQRRARGIAMGKAELDAFLTEQRTCRVATAGQDGPHLTPLWYVWDEAGVMHHTGHHAWLRLVPDKITSWDFRKKVSF